MARDKSGEREGQRRYRRESDKGKIGMGDIVGNAGEWCSISDVANLQ
jgi:hypothetical protein